MEREYLQKKAETLTKGYREPLTPLQDIAEKMGVELLFDEFGKHRYIIVASSDFNNKKIYVNFNTKTKMQRFAIAHELAHFVLHRKIFINNEHKYTVFPKFVEVKKSIYDKEADYFAAHLMVPTHLLTPVKDTALNHLSELFGVTKELIEHRLGEIKKGVKKMKNNYCNLSFSTIT